MKKIVIILIIIQLLGIFIVYGIDVSQNRAKILYEGLMNRQKQ